MRVQNKGFVYWIGRVLTVHWKDSVACATRYEVVVCVRDGVSALCRAIGFYCSKGAIARPLLPVLINDTRYCNSTARDNRGARAFRRQSFCSCSTVSCVHLQVHESHGFHLLLHVCSFWLHMCPCLSSFHAHVAMVSAVRDRYSLPISVFFLYLNASEICFLFPCFIRLATVPVCVFLLLCLSHIANKLTFRVNE